MRPLETDPQILPIDDEEIAYPLKGSEKLSGNMLGTYRKGYHEIPKQRQMLLYDTWDFPYFFLNP